MQIYLVGGAVRDKILGLKPKERDWVVVGSTPDEMLEQGFKPVGKEFPVFLHPKTGEEYALARTERKTAPGYHGFAFHADPGVTLEEDLIRRDLTVNAIAMDDAGNIIDPYNGREDLDNGLLRHVSDAFAEDPVRILRAARFAARFAKFGFRVAHDTNALMRRMVENGEVDALVPERVWKELSRALAEERPQAFFKVLRGCGALARLFPEIDALYGVPQPEQHHGEIDTGIHVMMVLEQAAKLSPEPVVRFAALTHDLGKGTTPEAEWPKHIAHEQRSAKLVKELCERFRIPNEFRDLAVHVARYHTHCHKVRELKPSTLLKTLESLDALRRPERFEQFLLACEADSKGRKDMEQTPYPQADYFRSALAAANAIVAKSVIEDGFSGKEIGDELHRRRVTAVAGINTQI
ncbi:multifunctional CCA tRNA nucleotidyl transferase/2'3'-cyclic phosphodiesterase/2'nucleotidase/phosphatase [Solemya pervernicosa gill symbiont]|uniref:Multifunctional CCA protein n=2 Tax=Gammaproteobacteria incertae sedis TaxID=118884 RepID=A0A1T2L041_9GAMM|nr:multifunctional CCA addition/repair protein [Candidatus Reidiella endopervernicosa]OOZ38424.1 multifunctional CCA tRNA nucleotidyl transferase/2'3'-cyclic phosphodiesterase/2'nucleotidase/phosphatase [Solemya pervernicosa gill symbiont]QKQ24956.1 multifunctional CCA addition/repair protein [Candidatus Reidiella endopervernicosa]